MKKFDCRRNRGYYIRCPDGTIYNYDDCEISNDIKDFQIEVNMSEIETDFNIYCGGA